MDEAPLRIEGYDISHLQGTHQVASMVVFEDGAPRKSAYRSFKIRTNPDGESNDVAAMKEVLQRRFQAEEEEGAKFSYPPDLLVVDGGLPQVNAAAAALEEIGVNVKVIGLAKRLEEVWVPGEEFPLILPRDSQALYLLQHLRDESHRRAIGQHRKKRTKALTQNAGLEQIPGVGPAKRAALIQHFGSLSQLSQASAQQIAQVKGINLELAQRVVAYFAARAKIEQIKEELPSNAHQG